MKKARFRGPGVGDLYSDFVGDHIMLRESL